MHNAQDVQFSNPVASLDCNIIPQWYALHSRAKHERKVAAELQRKGICAFVPTMREVHRWSDRRMLIEAPLFPCYTFVRTVLSPAVRLAVLQVGGVFRFVGFGNGPAAIPDSEIESIQAVLAKNVPFSSCGMPKKGDKVRVRGGALDGVEGVLISESGERRLVVSIELIQQSLSVVLEGYDVQPIAAAA